MSRLNGRRAEAEAQGLRVNVAILGAGRIAHSMARTLVAMAADPRYAGLVAPYAVAARDGGRAAAFAAEYGFPVSYGSYDELLADPDVDLVYIATPHSLHAEQGIACLKAGKNILVEKSFTANAAQARALLDAADGSGLLCTEAIWTRYMPSRAIVDRIVAAGRPSATSGAMYKGVPAPPPVERVETSMTPYAPTGVDAQNSTTLYYANGVMAVSTSSMLACSDRAGCIWGDKGYVVCRNINNIEAIDVYGADHAVAEHYDVPAQLTGYEYQVVAAANAILDGREECAEMPHADSLRIVELMDELRAKWGLKYPFE